MSPSTYGHDKYERTLAEWSCPMTNLNQELVKQGWCRWYRKYAPGDTVLEGLEKEAREGRKGLWVDPQPMPPWEWRKLISWRWRVWLQPMPPAQSLELSRQARRLTTVETPALHQTKLARAGGSSGETSLLLTLPDKLLCCLFR